MATLFLLRLIEMKYADCPDFEKGGPQALFCLFSTKIGKMPKKLIGFTLYHHLSIASRKQSQMKMAKKSILPAIGCSILMISAPISPIYLESSK